MYDYIDTRANEYLAQLARSSPKWAEVVLRAERDKASDLRMWTFEVLEAIVLGWHGRECGCPMGDFPDPVTRVLGSSRAIRQFVNDATEAEAIDPWHWVQSRDAETMVAVLMETQLLRECLEEAQQERAVELEARSRRWRRLVGDNDAVRGLGPPAAGRRT